MSRNEVTGSQLSEALSLEDCSLLRPFKSFIKSTVKKVTGSPKISSDVEAYTDDPRSCWKCKKGKKKKIEEAAGKEVFVQTFLIVFWGFPLGKLCPHKRNWSVSQELIVLRIVKMKNGCLIRSGASVSTRRLTQRRSFATNINHSCKFQTRCRMV